LEDVAASVEEPQWFQLYLLRDRGQSEHQIDLAKRCGFRVLVVTVDAPVSGNRERDVRNRLSIPVRVRPRMALSVVRRPRWMLDYFAGPPLIHANYGASSTGRTGSGGGTKLADHIRDMFNADQGWADLEWIRRAWDGPLVLKGVMSDIDARKAVELGCDGVIVSNHGGRQLDGLPASLDVLPEVVSAVGHQADVLIDGGFRRGTDVVKALALGAKACLIGRPWLFGLASGGEAGVRQVLETFRVEIDRTMALLGVAGCDELDHSVLRRRPGSGWERL
jgi:isopentenyl diphosphate isomerase/L-lactate dehydrogenase-like FMN-dependent dehydrogenase